MDHDVHIQRSLFQQEKLEAVTVPLAVFHTQNDYAAYY